MDGGTYGIYFVFTHPSIGLSPASNSWLLRKYRLSFATTKNPLPKRVPPKPRSRKLLLRFLSYPTQGGNSSTQLNFCGRIYTFPHSGGRPSLCRSFTLILVAVGSNYCCNRRERILLTLHIHSSLLRSPPFPTPGPQGSLRLIA